MKRLLIIWLAFSIVLVGCSISSPATSDEQKTEDTVQEQHQTISNDINNQQIEIEQNEDNSYKDYKLGDVVENDSGIFTLVKRTELNKSYVSEPIKLTIPAVSVVHVETKEPMKRIYDDRDELVYVSVNMIIENTIEDTISFYPDQLILVTNTGEQIEMPDMYLSDNLGGEFYGKVVKDGQVIIILEKSRAEDIEWVKLFINGASNEKFEKVGEDLEIKIEF